jgi:hypothetical protein
LPTVGEQCPHLSQGSPNRTGLFALNNVVNNCRLVAGNSPRFVDSPQGEADRGFVACAPAEKSGKGWVREKSNEKIPWRRFVSPGDQEVVECDCVPKAGAPLALNRHAGRKT